MHGKILWKDFSEGAMDFFGAREFDQADEKFGSYPTILKLIADKNSHLGDVCARGFVPSAHGDNFVLSNLWIVVLGNENHFAVLIGMADVRQTLVLHAIVEGQDMKIAM